MITIFKRIKIALGLKPITQDRNLLNISISNAEFKQIYTDTYIIVNIKIINTHNIELAVLPDISSNVICERVENVNSQNSSTIFINNMFLFDRNKEFSKTKATTVKANESIDKVLIFKTNFFPFLELTFKDKSGTEIKVSSNIINKIETII